MAIPWQLRSYARGGLLTTALLLAAALVAGAWSNYQGSRAAVGTLYRGQADVLEVALRNSFPPWEDSPDSAALGAFVDSFPEYGVSYLAVVDQRGQVQASVGEPAGPLALAGQRGPAILDQQFVEVGERIRLVLPQARISGADFRRFRQLGESSRRSRSEGAQAEPPNEPDPQQTEVTRLFQVADFEPVVANTLVARASRSLVLTVLSASILTLAALLFWRTSERYAAARVRMEEQRRLSVLGEMSAVMAHEIRNPLASLKGTAQLLAERLPEGSRELQRAERIVAESIRLETLTSDLLDFARSGPIQTSEVDAVELLHGSVADVDGADFEIRAPDGPLLWPIDARRMRHALVNLLQNATQAKPATHPPRVTVQIARGALMYEIRDFGPGLPDGASERVFEPFFTTRTNGTGLGLAVAQRVAEMHGGEISAGNDPEGGAVFRIVLPRQTR